MNSNICEEFFAVLADRNRLSILNLILDKDLTVNEISRKLNLEQSLVSHHLKLLKDHGFVDFSIDGKSRMYSVNKETMRPLLDIMRSHVSKFCGFACQHKINEWSAMPSVNAIEHETEVIIEKIKVLNKYSSAKLKSKKQLIEASDFFNKTLTQHFKEEEQTLFKAMATKEKKIVEELISEHNFMRKKFLELKLAVDSYEKSPDHLKKISNEIIRVIQPHIDKEENVLIPKARQSLSRKEFDRLQKHEISHQLSRRS